MTDPGESAPLLDGLPTALPELTAVPGGHFTELRALYEGSPALQAPGDWLK